MNSNSSYKYGEISADELAQLVREAKKRKTTAVNKLCKFIYEKIFSYTYYRVRQREDAEDLTSEVILKVIRALKTQHGNFLAWVYRIANNSIIDYYRRKARQPEISLQELRYDIAGPQPEVPRLTEKQMKQALAHLSPEQADVIVLRFIQDYNTEEVAKILGKTVGAVKVLQFRALKALREYLQREGYGTK